MGARGRTALVVVAALAAVPAGASASQYETLSVYHGPFEQAPNSAVFDPHMSADGRYVAFSSAATNLHPDDTDGNLDAYVRDTQTGVIVLVGRAGGAAGAKANGPTVVTSISADGRYVALDSNASNLHPDDIDTTRDVFVRDLWANANILVSRATGAAGAKGNANSLIPVISADGRRVAFQSIATNLHPDDADGNGDTYLRDLDTNTTTLVSRATGAGGVKNNGGTTRPEISADGRKVTFEASATNLDAADSDIFLDVYVRDVDAATTALVSRASGAAGAKGNATSGDADLSPDGRYVSFLSDASNLSPDDPDGTRDVFVRDLQADTTTLVSRASGASGAKGNGHSRGSAIAADGFYVTFESDASNLDTADPDTTRDVYVRDMRLGVTNLASRATGAAGVKADAAAALPSISDDGRYVAFASVATNLHPDDTDSLEGYFRRQLLPDPAAPTPPQGPPGPTGPSGPQGPPGPQGERAPLALAMAQARWTARRGRRLVIPYVSTRDAAVTLEIRKGRRRIAQVRKQARAGRNRIAWSGRVRRKPVAPGRYTVRLLAAAPDGETARDAARLTITRR